jgi:hypothetical protein
MDLLLNILWMLIAMVVTLAAAIAWMRWPR